MRDEIQQGIENLWQQAPELAMTWGTKIIMAIVIFIIGKWLARLITGVIEKGMNARSVDKTIVRFTRNIVYYLMVTIVVIAALGEIGVQTASFVAVVGAAGLAIGLALQGSLSNFASGVLLIIFRPIRVGDYVEAGGTGGTVYEISLFTTTFKTPDNKTVTVSNKDIFDGNIVNYSIEPTRRVDFKIGVSYDANLQATREVLQKIADEEERVLKDKDVVIAVGELGDSAVVFYFRLWVNTPDYWPVYFATMEKVKNRLDEAGIGIPYPQMDVYVKELAKDAAA
ncbi:Small-conductance mechanosensitive channel [Thalassocella blandensis]|nr:Small-conductance mechanosensitive channel [Thalassocella blandensis]